MRRILQACSALVTLAVAQAGPGGDVLRIGLTEAVITEANTSDARAAFKVWSETIVAEKNLKVTAEVDIYQDTEALRRDLVEGRIDLMAAAVDEYQECGGPALLNDCFLQIRNGKAEDSMVLLVRADGPIHDAASAAAGRLAVLDNSRTRHGLAWFNTLGGEPLSAADVFTGTKVSQIVLRVFFRQADACIVHREGYEMMVQMNPQVGREMRILAESPPLVPAVIGFRRTYASDIRADLIAALLGAHEQKRGAQVLTVFMIERIVQLAPDGLAATEQFLSALGRLPGAAEAKP